MAIEPLMRDVIEPLMRDVIEPLMRDSMRDSWCVSLVTLTI